MCCAVMVCLLALIAEGYKSEAYPWWEAVIMLRKLALQCIAVLFSDLFVQGGWVVSTQLMDGLRLSVSCLLQCPWPPG